jgi:hypothetical protein
MVTHSRSFRRQGRSLTRTAVLAPGVALTGCSDRSTSGGDTTSHADIRGRDDSTSPTAERAGVIRVLRLDRRGYNPRPAKSAAGTIARGN